MIDKCGMKFINKERDYVQNKYLLSETNIFSVLRQ